MKRGKKSWYVANIAFVSFYVLHLKVVLFFSLLCICSQKAYSYYLSKKSVYGEPSFLDQLPQPLLFRLVRQIHQEDIRLVKLFHTYETDFVVPLLLGIKPMEAVIGEDIFLEGDICESIVFVKKGKIAISASNGVTSAMNGVVKSGGYFGDFEYLNKTTCVATYTATKHSHLLAVSHGHMNYACAKSTTAGLRFNEDIAMRYEAFREVILQHKKTQSGHAHTLEEAQRIVEKALAPKDHSGSGGGKRKHRNSTSRRLSATSRSQPTLWIDGEIVSTQDPKAASSANLKVPRRTSQGSDDMADDEVIHVIQFDKELNKVCKGEAHPSDLLDLWIIDPSHTYKLFWDIFTSVVIVYSIIIVPMELGFGQNAYPLSPTIDNGKASRCCCC
jgi:CRP-like cAMP-binding protein